MEKVLVVENFRIKHSIEEGLSTSPVSKSLLMNILRGTGFYVPKDEAEVDENLRQVIPYVVFLSGGKVFVYRRSAKGVEKRLHELYSIGVGGHVNLTDYVNSINFNLSSCVRSAAYREIEEELNVVGVSKGSGESLLDSYATIMGNDQKVDRVHIGVVFLCKVSEASKKSFLEGGSDHLVDRQWVPLEAIKSSGLNFESWSQLILKSLEGSDKVSD